MNVHRYQTAGGKDLILNYIESLTKKEQIDGFSVLEKLQEEKFDELKIKPWRGKISEVYFHGHNRMFYVIADGVDLYVLHACRKQKNKTEAKDADKVIERAKTLGESLSKKFV